MDDEEYILTYPNLEDLWDDQNYIYTLATIDTCPQPFGTKFCSGDGNDIMPIRTIKMVWREKIETLDTREGNSKDLTIPL